MSILRLNDNVGPTLARATEEIIEEEEGGLHDLHMEVVNGWCASITVLCCCCFLTAILPLGFIIK